ncbi:hypothetical protein [Cellulomonas alba]|uniref:Carboxypeptidase regulatory-like domain-containing protein n=1 Tax=Cellulomonas alba TaxID=3053467 RepID=A0ABT7SBV2_9CELL|nr:hypothetical protein [Cellulomonas alba]MDM7853663.1 hypothetical protein [Cellulomonas alba]
MSRSYAAAISVVAVVAGGLVAAPAVAAPDTPGPETLAKVAAGSVTHGAALSLAGAAAPVAFTGAVKDPSGRAVPDATITLVAWPTDAELAKLRPGDPVPMTRIGITSADASGKYALSLDSAAVKQWLAARPTSAEINVELAATTDTTAAVAATTLTVDGVSGSAGGVATFAAPDASGATVSPRLPVPVQNFTTAIASGTWQPAAPTSAGAVGIDLITKITASSAAATAKTASVTSDATVTAAAASSVCGVYKKSYGDQKVTLAEVSGTHNQWAATYTYKQSQSSTLGMGISSTGAYGSFSAGGTQSSSASSTAGFQPQSGVYGYLAFRTTWQYGQYYENFCSPRNVYYYTARPVQWKGAVLNEGGPDIFNATYCSPISANNYALMTTNTETTMSGGVSIGPVIGINLSSQTGFSTTGSLKVTLKRSGQLCGSKRTWNQNDAGALTVK